MRGWGWEVQSMFGKQHQPGMTEAEEAGLKGLDHQTQESRVGPMLLASGSPWYPGPPSLAPLLNLEAYPKPSTSQSSLHLQYTIQGAWEPG